MNLSFTFYFTTNYFINVNVHVFDSRNIIFVQFIKRLQFFVSLWSDIAKCSKTKF